MLLSCSLDVDEECFFNLSSELRYFESWRSLVNPSSKKNRLDELLWELISDKSSKEEDSAVSISHDRIAVVRGERFTEGRENLSCMGVCAWPTLLNTRSWRNSLERFPDTASPHEAVPILRLLDDLPWCDFLRETVGGSVSKSRVCSVNALERNLAVGI